MSPSRTPTLVDDSHWPTIVTQLLDGTEPERRQAHEVLWVQVRHFVVDIVRLRIGSLGDDPDVRRDVAVEVMRKLKKRRWEQMRLWRAKLCERGETGTWWGFVATLAQTSAIDAARKCKQRLSRRGDPYRFARELPLDALDFLENRMEGDIAEYLVTLIDLRRKAAKPAAAANGAANGNGQSQPHRKRGEDGEGNGGAR
jgi:hypothetical protein